MASYRRSKFATQSQLSIHRSIGLTDEEVDAIIQGFADEDQASGKTWTRLVVENFLGKQKWYFPRTGDPTAPSLSTAYAYYEHITLPRHFVGGNVADHALHRAEPGENSQETELYNPFTTPQSSFIEWGIGVDLYFSSLRALAFVLLVAGIISIPALMYYAGSDYNIQDKQSSDVSFSLLGSAVCTSQEWVVCTDCEAEPFNDDINERERFGVADDGTILVQRNLCEGVVYQTVITHWVTLIFLTAVVMILSLYWSAREIRFDEDK
jgi:hypothetical protein